MASEYESFAALGYNHTQVKFEVNYVKAEEFVQLPPTFEELWCQGAPSRLQKREIRKEEKLFWRSRHRLEFIMEEHRKHKAIVVHVRETESNTHWRPIVVDLEVLFPLIDDKKLLKEGTREVKEGSGLDDIKIGRAAADYLMARLKVAAGRDEKPLPPWFQPGSQNTSSASEKPDNEVGGAESSSAAETSAQLSAPPPTSGGVEVTNKEAAVASDGKAGVVEDQAVLDKLSHDTWEMLEKAPPPGLLDEDPWYAAWMKKVEDLKGEEALGSEVDAGGDGKPSEADGPNSATSVSESTAAAASAAVAPPAAAAAEAATNAKQRSKEPAKKETGKKVAPSPSTEGGKGTTRRGSTTSRIKGKSNKVSPSP